MKIVTYLYASGYYFLLNKYQLQLKDMNGIWKQLTILGLKGGLILRSSISFHLTSRKKGWCLMDSSPPWDCKGNTDAYLLTFDKIENLPAFLVETT